MRISANDRPTVIILASQPLENGLSEIFGKRETASLMIGGSPLIEHVLNELHDLNFTQCIVLARSNARDIYKMVAGFQHWAMNIEVMSYALSKDEVLREFKSMSEPSGLLLIDANQLRSKSIKEFLDNCNKSDYLLYDAEKENNQLGLTYLKPSKADFIINAKPISMPEVMVNRLTSTRDFQKANLDLIMGRYDGLEASVSCHAIGPRLEHWSAKVHRRNNIDSASVMIDRQCCIERNVSLSSVVLNRDVYIEHNTILENTIVMPDAVIPANQYIRNAIIQGNTIYTVCD